MNCLVLSEMKLLLNTKSRCLFETSKILPEVFANMDIEKIKLMDKLSLLEKINKASDRRELSELKLMLF